MVVGWSLAMSMHGRLSAAVVIELEPRNHYIYGGLEPRNLYILDAVPCLNMQTMWQQLHKCREELRTQ